MIYVIKSEHLGIGWEQNFPLFVDGDSVIFPSRKSCLEYLLKRMKKDIAVDVISKMTKEPNTFFSF